MATDYRRNYDYLTIVPDACLLLFFSPSNRFGFDFFQNLVVITGTGKLRNQLGHVIRSMQAKKRKPVITFAHIDNDLAAREREWDPDDQLELLWDRYTISESSNRP